jgi:hypothetical protein
MHNDLPPTTDCANGFIKSEFLATGNHESGPLVRGREVRCGVKYVTLAVAKLKSASMLVGPEAWMSTGNMMCVLGPG